jgi:hypothetical protein
VKQSSLLIKLGASLLHNQGFGRAADEKLIEAIDQSYPHPMEADTVDWLAEIFNPFLYSMETEVRDFTKLLPHAGVAPKGSNFLYGWKNQKDGAANDNLVDTFGLQNGFVKKI